MESSATATTKHKILELMQVPSQDHDADWLRTSLQAAVELEMSTIPPYLCAMWSIKDSADPVRAMIRNIVLEEMSHLGMACNMLTAIGGTPALNTADVVPTYPGPLPGGVHPGLVVSLSGLTKDVIESVFMEIELPESGPVAFAEGMAFPTIGAFYDSILQAFQQIPAGTVTGERQLTHPFGGPADLQEIKSVADAENAIGRIKQQGEGTAQSPVGDPGGPGDNLAHYYQFAEIWHGRRLVASNGTWEFTGDPIPFPDVYPMAIVPAEGYPVQSAEFDNQYKSLLDGLQAAWTNGSSDDLLNAIGVMDSMGQTAVSLMQTPLPTGEGNFGPDFKLPT